MKLWTKFKHLMTRRSRLRRLEEEMHDHIERLTDEGVARGLDRAEARRQAHVAFGNVLATREESEEALGWPTLESVVHDGVIAIRSLSRRAGFTVSLVLVLALGIGVTTAVATLLRGVLLAPLPVPHPEELHLVVDPAGDLYQMSAPMVRRLESDPAMAGRVAAYSGTSRVAVRQGNGPAEAASVQFVNGGFFGALGVPAAMGRTLLPTDDREGDSRAVAVASHAFLQRQFNSAEDAVGRVLRINGVEVTIVGVAPRSFAGVTLGNPPDLWLPLGQHASLGCAPSAWAVTNRELLLSEWMQADNVAWILGLVRGQPPPRGALESAWLPHRDAITGLISDAPTQQEYRARVPRFVHSPRGSSHVRDDFRRIGLTLGSLVTAVVLVTAANSATLLLLRMLGRGRELGVRMALGAGRWRLARGALMEGLLLASVGAAAGALLGVWLSPVLATWLVPSVSDQLPGFDWTMLGALAALAIVLGVAMGAAPAWLAARLSPQSVLKERIFGSGGTLRFGRGLIVAQLALSVMLISITGALAFDLRRAIAADPGYARESVVQAFFDLAGAGIGKEARDAVLERIRAAALQLPQVRAVGFASNGALSGSRSASGVYFRGEQVKQPKGSIQHETIDPDYLDALGLRLVRGRKLTADDRGDRSKAALISERLAREAFGDADPIGRRFGFDQITEDPDWEIVGVVGDARMNGVRDAPPAMIFTPLAQWRPATPTCLVVRVDGDAVAFRPTLQQAISAVEPGIMFSRWATLQERAERALRNDRAAMRLTGGFGVLATLLAVIGVLGALGYLVASRSREIAVRLAIGADPARVWRGILRDAATLGLVGSLLGSGLALAFPRVFGAWMMSGLNVDAAATIMAIVAGLGAAILGGLLPARRAAKIDPVALLRAE